MTGGTGRWAIETVDLCKEFTARRLFPLPRRRLPEKTLAVDHVSIRIAAGEIFGLVGPNGAGKTTLIKVLTTMFLPTSGMARIGGLDVVEDGHEVRKLVGLVTSNERSFYWRLSGRQNMEFFAALYRIPPREARERIEELFGFLDLREVADRRFDGYSTGMRQRLAITRGLLTRPRILFMDEPTKGVDPINSAQIITLVREKIVKLWNSTILITSHNLREIERLCDRIAIMNRGRIRAVGTLSELRSLTTGGDAYRFRVLNVPADRLRTIAEAAGARPPLRISVNDGIGEMDIRIERGNGGFPGIIRSIIESGGDILECTSIQESFDDVFQEICNRVSPAVADAEKGFPS